MNHRETVDAMVAELDPRKTAPAPRERPGAMAEAVNAAAALIPEAGSVGVMGVGLVGTDP